MRDTTSYPGRKDAEIIARHKFELWASSNQVPIVPSGIDDRWGTAGRQSPITEAIRTESQRPGQWGIAFMLARFTPDYRLIDRSWNEIKATARVNKTAYEQYLRLDAHQPVYIVCALEADPAHLRVCRVSEIQFCQVAWQWGPRGPWKTILWAKTPNLSLDVPAVGGD